MAKKRTAKKTLSTYNWRYMTLVGSLLFLASALSARIVYLQVLDKEFLNKQANARIIRTEKISSHRGMISDRNGRPLAISTPVISVWADPKALIVDQDRWQELAKKLGLRHRDLKNKILKNQRKRFVYLKRHMSPDLASAALDLELEGVYGETEYRRFYPAGEVAAHVVGLTNIDDKGLEGIELAYDGTLKGEAGKKKVIKSRKGRVVKDLEILKYAHAGDDIELSLDLRAQYITYKELSVAVEKFHARSASAIAVDIETGEILALVNKPSFNPNNRKHINAKALRNRAVTDLFEPGSTVKPFTVLSALESGKFNTESQLDTRPGYFKVGRKTIRDHRNYGVIDIETVLVKSSNVGTTKLALALDDGELLSMMRRVGFGQLVQSGLPGESGGVITETSRQRPIEIATMSYGYGLSVTALQLANAYTILANGGLEKPLSILKQTEQPVGERVVSEKDSREILSMLEKVVSVHGTASRAQVPGYSVAGKTGTVHRVVNGAYAADQYTSLFAGIAPAKDPKIVVVVVVNEPKGDEYYGGLVAAPAFSKIMGGVLRVMNVDPDQSEVFQANLERSEQQLSTSGTRVGLDES